MSLGKKHNVSPILRKAAPTALFRSSWSFEASLQNTERKRHAVSQKWMCCCLRNPSTIQERRAQKQRLALSCWPCTEPRAAHVCLHRRALSQRETSALAQGTQRTHSGWVWNHSRGADQCCEFSATWPRRICSAGFSEQRLAEFGGLQRQQLGNIQEALERIRKEEWESCPKLGFCLV